MKKGWKMKRKGVRKGEKRERVQLNFALIKHA